MNEISVKFLLFFVFSTQAALLALATFGFVIFTDFLMNDGKPLAFYYRFLLNLSETGKIGGFFAKPLGLCMICFGSWLAIFMSIFWVIYGIPFMVVFVYLGIHLAALIAYFTRN